MSKIATRRDSMIPTRQSVTRNTEVKSKLAAPRNSISSTKSKLKIQTPSNTNKISGTSTKTTTKASNKSSVFSVTPTLKLLEERSIPEDLQGRPHIIGNQSQIESLYTYTKDIARSIFTSQYFKMFFPDHFSPSQYSRLSIISNNSRSSIMSTASHIPVFRKSSLFPNANLNDSSPENFSFSSAFEHLETLITKCKTKVIAITDFCLLYPSLILSINQNSSESALHFLNEFLELKSTRSQEANILFAVLINLYNSFSDEKELVVSVLGKLAQLEDCICTRLQNGAKHQDENLSSLCIKVLTKIGIQIKDSGTQFSNISENSDEKEAIQILSEYVEALENNGQPSDISDFMMNIVTVMQRFNDSAVVLVHAATCAEAVLPFYTEASVEVVYHCISICASILSGETFLNGDKSFEASEAIQNLFNELFQNISPEILRKSIEANVAESNDMKLKPILEQLHMIKCDNSEEFIKPIIDSLEIFHPKYELPQFLMKLKKKKSFELLQESIQRLTNPETVFEEIEEVTCKSVDGDFGNYPKHLLVMLQTSWIIKTRKIPPNCDENMYNDVMNSIQKIMKMSDDEIDESEFGYKANTERYQQIVSC